MRIGVIQAEIGERGNATRPRFRKAEGQRFTGEFQGRVAPTALSAAPQRLEKAGIVSGHLLPLFVQKGADRGHSRDRAREFPQERGDHGGGRSFAVGARDADTKQGASPRRRGRGWADGGHALEKVYTRSTISN